MSEKQAAYASREACLDEEGPRRGEGVLERGEEVLRGRHRFRGDAIARREGDPVHGRPLQVGEALGVRLLL